MTRIQYFKLFFLHAPAVIVGALWCEQSLAATAFVESGQSIQVSIDTLSPGDTIVVSPGYYAETLQLHDRNLTIASFWLLTRDTSYLLSTVLSPSPGLPDTGTCVALQCPHCDSSVLAGLTLRGGYGVYWTTGQSTAGGAVFVSEGRLLLDHCVVDSSTAAFGGGVAVVADDSTSAAQLTLHATTIRNCLATSWGGGLYSIRSTLIVDSSLFAENSADLGGGGLIAFQSEIGITECSFLDNLGIEAGIELNACRGTLFGCLFQGNTAFSNSESCDILCANSSVVCTGCSFLGLTTSGSRVVLCCDHVAEVEFSRNILLGCAGSRDPVLLLAGVQGNISHNVFHSISGSRATIYGFQATTMRIHHNVFASIYNDNPVLRTGPNFHGSLDSNWIEGNSGDCFFDAIPPADSIHAENNWWGDVSGPYHSALNPNGLGDTLGYGLVDFVPWLTSPPDTSWSVVSPTRPHIPSTWALLNVFPNPFNSEIRIEIAGFARNGFSIKLYNLLGREVAVLHDGPLTGNSLSFVAPPGLASGVYLLRASDKTSSSTRKVILLK